MDIEINSYLFHDNEIYSVINKYLHVHSKIMHINIITLSDLIVTVS